MKKKLLSGFYIRDINIEKEFFTEKKNGDKVPFKYTFLEKLNDLKKMGRTSCYYSIIQFKLDSSNMILNSKQSDLEFKIYFASMEGEFMSLAADLEDSRYSTNHCVTFSPDISEITFEFNFQISNIDLYGVFSNEGNELLLRKRLSELHSIKYETIGSYRYIPYKMHTWNEEVLNFYRK